MLRTHLRTPLAPIHILKSALGLALVPVQAVTLEHSCFHLYSNPCTTGRVQREVKCSCEALPGMASHPEAPPTSLAALRHIMAANLASKLALGSEHLVPF